MQIQDGLRVPTCYPGIVYMRGVEKSPPKSKWADVEWPKGAIKVDWRLAKRAMCRFDRPKTWEEAVKADLEKIPRSKPKFTHALCAVGVSGFYPAVSAMTAFNQFKAAAGRIFRREDPNDPLTPEWGKGPKEGVWEKAWTFVDILLPGLVSKMMNVEAWLQSMPARRKVALNAAFERLKRNGWKKGYAKFSAFVKTELLPGIEKNKRFGELEPLREMLDRLIQGPRDETHVIAGPHLKPLTEKLKEVWDVDQSIFYAASTPEKLQKFLERLIKNALINGTCDFSMFDATHSKGSFWFMEKLYERAGIKDKMFWKVFNVWQRPRGAIGPLKYQAPTMNASGRDDTSLLNAVLNGVCTTLSIASVIHRVDLLELTEEHVRATMSQLVLGVAGDDSIWTLKGVDRGDIPNLKTGIAKAVREFGFVSKLQISTRINDMVFLGMRPYPVGGKWMWGKTIGRAVYKMGWTLLARKTDLLAHISGTHEMHLKCSPHVPIIADIARRVCELRAGCRKTPVEIDPNRPWEWTQVGNPTYDRETLEYVAETYSTDKVRVTVGDVEQVIAQIRGISAIPCVVESWLLEHMGFVDDL